MSPSGVLEPLIAAIGSGAVEVVDLTHALDADFPVIVLPPEFGQCARFRVEEISAYDHRGPAWKWRNFSCGEHAGTHLDAPIHWVTGRDVPFGAVDEAPLERLVAPACVIDCSAESAADEDFLMEPSHVEAWEARHGRIPTGAWALMRTDWSRRRGVAYLNMRADGPHSPGPSPACVRLLVERGVVGFGTECVGTDAGQGAHLDPPYPAHAMLHGAGRYGLQCLANLEKLPPTGALLVAAPLKMKGGTGSPLRVIAFVERPPS